jgi:hypothetical protein
MPNAKCPSRCSFGAGLGFRNPVSQRPDPAIAQQQRQQLQQRLQQIMLQQQRQRQQQQQQQPLTPSQLQQWLERMMRDIAVEVPTMIRVPGERWRGPLVPRIDEFLVSNPTPNMKIASGGGGGGGGSGSTYTEVKETGPFPLIIQLKSTPGHLGHLAAVPTPPPPAAADPSADVSFILMHARRNSAFLLQCIVSAACDAPVPP